MTVHESDAIQDSPQQTRRGVGLLTNVLCVAAMLGAWWAFSAPRGLEIIFMLLGLLLVWSVIGLYWFTRLFSCLRSNAERQTKMPLAARVSWSLVPVLCAAMIVTVYLRLPLRVRFEASRAAMNSVLNDQRKGLPFNGPRWVGWYYVTEAGNTEAVNYSIWISLESDVGFQHYSRADENPYGGIPLRDGWYTYAHFPT
jgi:hypothetical protein